MNFTYFLNRETNSTFPEATFEANQFGNMLDGITLIVEVKGGKLDVKAPANDDGSIAGFLTEEKSNILELLNNAYMHLTFKVDNVKVELV